jgi:hypothetical protein
MARKYLSEIVGRSTYNEHTPKDMPHSIFKSQYVLVTETAPGKCKTDTIYYPVAHNGDGGLPLEEAIKLLEKITEDLRRELDA